jgi:hypothetical protein
MRNVSDKSCRGNQNSHFMFNNFFFENRAVYDKMWKKAKSIVAFALQQWLHERATMLHYTYISCLVIHKRFCLMIETELV